MKPTYLDNLLTQRQTVRSFSQEAPSKELLEQVIEAGRLAPFAGLVQKDCEEFRKFFVIHRNSQMIGQVKELVEAGRRQEAARVKAEGLDLKYPKVAELINGLSTKPANDVLIAPYLIIVAERGGLPQREQVCLGYVLENMWLKATELGLGIKICSGVADIADTDSVKKLFGLSEDEVYAFDAVSIGIPSREAALRTSDRKPSPSIQYFEN